MRSGGPNGANRAAGAAAGIGDFCGILSRRRAIICNQPFVFRLGLRAGPLALHWITCEFQSDVPSWQQMLAQGRTPPCYRKIDARDSFPNERRLIYRRPLTHESARGANLFSVAGYAGPPPLSSMNLSLVLSMPEHTRRGRFRLLSCCDRGLSRNGRQITRRFPSRPAGRSSPPNSIVSSHLPSRL